MTLPYLGRLACFCLAAFFLCHTAVAAAIYALASCAIRRASRMFPRTAARFILALRLLPPAAASVLVLGLCVPSYLVLERNVDTEQVGGMGLMLALLAVVICAAGIARAAKAAVQSEWHLRRQKERGVPLFLLAGVFRPRLIVSAAVRDVLTREEFEAALLHERAHGRARDNFKRLLILGAPDALPFLRGFELLDACWNRLSEWAADDSAVEGSPERALALASALVRVGRIGAAVPQVQLGTSLVADGKDLAIRVERLIEGERRYAPPRHGLLAGALAVLVAAAVLSGPSTFRTVHQLLELLAH